jgi:hypothetical protein
MYPEYKETFEQFYNRYDIKAVMEDIEAFRSLLALEQDRKCQFCIDCKINCVKG